MNYTDLRGCFGRKLATRRGKRHTRHDLALTTTSDISTSKPHFVSRLSPSSPIRANFRSINRGTIFWRKAAPNNPCLLRCGTGFRIFLLFPHGGSRAVAQRIIVWQCRDEFDMKSVVSSVPKHREIDIADIEFHRHLTLSSGQRFVPQRKRTISADQKSR